uniref:DUF834 domain-containing protein n=1 Tax=Oryza barthii TaxID=65489 RepID=A0A0D3H9F3_9ORYZ
MTSSILPFFHLPLSPFSSPSFVHRERRRAGERALKLRWAIGRWPAGRGARLHCKKGIADILVLFAFKSIVGLNGAPVGGAVGDEEAGEVEELSRTTENSDGIGEGGEVEQLRGGEVERLRGGEVERSRTAEEGSDGELAPPMVSPTTGEGGVGEGGEVERLRGGKEGSDGELASPMASLSTAGRGRRWRGRAFCGCGLPGGGVTAE